MSKYVWWRKIPHLNYGNYGGRGNHGRGHTQKPIDEMDKVFQEHDLLFLTTTDVKRRLKADKKLLEDLKNVKVRSISKPIYGTFYKYMCICIFSLVIKYNKEA